MQWRIILALTSGGVIIGIASVIGVTRSVELLLWLVIAIFFVYWISRKVGSRQFIHGFLTGVFTSVSNSTIQLVLFDTYLANNPESAIAFATIPAGIDPRVFLLLVGILVGAMYGLVVGLFATLTARLSTGLPA